MGRPAGWFQNWRPTIEWLLAASFNFASPRRCPACLRDVCCASRLCDVLPALCEPCRQAVLPSPGNVCARCAAPVGPFVVTDAGCLRCRRRRFRFESVVRLGIYQDELRAMCLAAKQTSGEELAAALADLLWDERQATIRGARADLVLPVPHHWSESIRAAPHVSETVATVLARRLRGPLAPHILSKVRRTPKQSGLAPSRRRENLKGAFRVPREFRSDVRGRRILLVDDVLTTGSTAGEISRVLLGAGAASVVVTVLARGLGNRPAPSRSG